MSDHSFALMSAKSLKSMTKRANSYRGSVVHSAALLYRGGYSVTISANVCNCAKWSDQIGGMETIFTFGPPERDPPFSVRSAKTFSSVTMSSATLTNS